MKKAILLISHGSYSKSAFKEVVRLAKELKRRSRAAIFEYAFLEISHPNIPHGIKNCIDKGATEITIVLNFLNSGIHVARDIPHLVKLAKTAHPEVSFKIAGPIGQHKQIPELFLTQIHQPRSLKKI